jgi:predicted Zn-dependent peptidase
LLRGAAPTDTKLKNGLRVIVSEDHAAPVFSVVVAYNVGSRDERTGRTARTENRSRRLPPPSDK